MEWIIVGTYKTNPENQGWYIANVYIYLFWQVLNYHFNTEFFYENTENTYDINNGYGYIREKPEIKFYDLLKNHENNQVNGNSDRDLWDNEVLRNRMMTGADNLINFLQNRKVKTRVGLVGRLAAGIVINRAQGINIFNWNINHINLNDGYGIINNINLGDNNYVYLLENITAQYFQANYQNHAENLEGWAAFWQH